MSSLYSNGYPAAGLRATRGAIVPGITWWNPGPFITYSVTNEIDDYNVSRTLCTLVTNEDGSTEIITNLTEHARRSIVLRRSPLDHLGSRHCGIPLRRARDLQLHVPINYLAAVSKAATLCWWHQISPTKCYRLYIQVSTCTVPNSYAPRNNNRC